MRVKTNQVHLNVEGEYDRSDTSRPPVIFLHGFTLSSRDWLPLFPSFEEAFQLIAIDIIGHGNSDAPDNPEYYTFQSGIDQIIAAIQSLGISKAAWVGYSMGGRLLYGIAVTHPELVSHLVFESTTPGIPDQKDRLERQQWDEQMARFIERNSMNTFVDRWLSHPLFETLRSLPPDRQEFTRNIRLSNSPRGLANSLRGMGRGVMPSYWGNLAEIHVPTLITAGEGDPEHIRTAKKASNVLPNVETELVAGAGHNIHFERPDFFCEITQHFLLTS